VKIGGGGITATVFYAVIFVSCSFPREIGYKLRLPFAALRRSDNFLAAAYLYKPTFFFISTLSIYHYRRNASHLTFD
jgi:hypothetical protein